MAPACNPAFTLPRDSGAPAYIHKQTLALCHAELGTHSITAASSGVALHRVTCPRASLRAEAGGGGPSEQTEGQGPKGAAQCGTELR